MQGWTERGPALALGHSRRPLALPAGRPQLAVRRSLIDSLGAYHRACSIVSCGCCVWVGSTPGRRGTRLSGGRAVPALAPAERWNCCRYRATLWRPNPKRACGSTRAVCAPDTGSSSPRAAPYAALRAAALVGPKRRREVERVLLRTRASCGASGVAQAACGSTSPLQRPARRPHPVHTCSSS